jgi:L-alanine-DL-glutamate epimerase-like enolase superfamily enzyme
MIIKEVENKLFSVPFIDPTKLLFVPLETTDLLIVEIETNESFIGTGYLQPIIGRLLTVEMCINEMLKLLLIGESIQYIKNLWQKM